MSLKMKLRNSCPGLYQKLQQGLWAGKYYAILLKKRQGKRYLNFRMDINNGCNLRCKYCYTLALEKQPYHEMNLDEFKKVADVFFPRAKRVALSCAWEPLLNRQFKDYIELVSKYNVPEVFFVTNGQMLSSDIIEASIRAKVSEIGISIDSADEKIYEDIRVNAKFSKLVDNLRLIKELKEKHSVDLPRVMLSFVAFQENAEHAALLLKKYGDLFQAINIVNINTRKRNEDVEYSRIDLPQFQEVEKECMALGQEKGIAVTCHYNPPVKRPSYCYSFLEDVLVNCWGDIELCNRHILGNVVKEDPKVLFKNLDKLIAGRSYLKSDYCQNHCGT